MRITLAAVGRAKSGPARDLYDFYATRLSDRLLGKLILKEVELRQTLPAGEQRSREAELLLAAVPQGAVLIALDAAGRQLDSEAFAALVARHRQEGTQNLAFVVGGAEGLADSILGRADMILSLGPMIWPHLLVRGLLAEQLYRAQCILSGHPYHRS